MYSKASPRDSLKGGGGRKTTAGVLEGFAPGDSQIKDLLSDSGLRPSLRSQGKALVANQRFGRKAKPCSAEVVCFASNPPPLRDLKVPASAKAAHMDRPTRSQTFGLVASLSTCSAKVVCFASNPPQLRPPLVDRSARSQIKDLLS